MDAIGHAVITEAVSDNPLAIVASAINLMYNWQKLEQLRQTLPQQYSQLATGIASHIKANTHVHKNPLFLEMQRQARPILTGNGVRDIFSHVTVEAAIDYLLMQDPEVKAHIEAAWQRFDWEAALQHLPQFSRHPARAENAISYVKQQPTRTGVNDAARLLQYLVTCNGRTANEAVACTNSMTEIICMLTKSGGYKQLIYEAQRELQQQFGVIKASV